ncbi:long-chain-fatty-acid--CoA ligase [Variovorax sp. GB1R11]|uniref:long-chain-fatty-acid--CoA ligase n=1 Tax=Variovorax sp. GB1R11 TaxID=3443741 RepID=UPI003F489DB7
MPNMTDAVAPLRSAASPFWPKGLPTTLHVPRTHLFHNIEVAAERYPDKPAYRYFESVTTFARLRRDAEAIAGHLQRHAGVERGDRVMVIGQSSPQFATAVHAVLRADAVAVPVNPMNLTPEIAHCAEDSGARVAIVAQELLERVAPLLGTALSHLLVFTYGDAFDGPGTEARADDVPEWVRAPRAPLPDRRTVHWADALAAAHPPAARAAAPDDLCLIAYTSGTTGKPKGCMHTHASLMTGGITSALWRGDRPDTVVLGVAPMFHMQGFQSLITTAGFMANTVVLLPRWDARSAAMLIERHRVNQWGVSPAMLLDLLALEDLKAFDIASLGTVTGGGAGLPEAVNRRLSDELGVRYLEGWGMTETASMAACNPPLHSKRQCLGIPTFGVEVRIVDPVTGVPVPDGETGELLVSGGQVMKGYWRNPQADAQTFREIDGRRFLRTGDLVHRDADGYLFIVDRLKRMINASGFKVWPAEVESLMHMHPSVQEACVIAARDPRRGEVVKAVVVRRRGAQHQVSETELIEWARSQMAAYKCPRSVKFVERLPRAGTGKIDWRRLQEEERARG